MGNKFSNRKTLKIDEVLQKYQLDHITLPPIHPDPLESINLTQKIYHLLRIDGDIFEKIQKKLESEGIEFIVKPQKRYEGKVGEQMTMFVFDFSGNPLEFKSFRNSEEVFK